MYICLRRNLSDKQENDSGDGLTFNTSLNLHASYGHFHQLRRQTPPFFSYCMYLWGSGRLDRLSVLAIEPLIIGRIRSGTVNWRMMSLPDRGGRCEDGSKMRILILPQQKDWHRLSWHASFDGLDAELLLTVCVLDSQLFTYWLLIISHWSRVLLHVALFPTKSSYNHSLPSSPYTKNVTSSYGWNMDSSWSHIYIRIWRRSPHVEADQ